ncbi:MAG TPA: YceD family protein [Steroidobacteraceae bacterium]|nr:YceD family protein [Steroidobacteraceae bacterium]
MSPPWSKPLDIDRLADSEADVAFVVSLAELPRLRSRLEGVSGTVAGHVRFSREAGLVVADVEVSGDATLICQRCLQPMSEPVNSSVRVALIATEAALARVPDQLEPVLAAGGRISIGELVEEELLLALPIVPLHAPAAACIVAKDAPLVSEDKPDHTTQRPFERLSELLKR